MKTNTYPCMPDTLIIHNNGPLLVSSNYWTTDMARAGYLYLSFNAGAFRLLIPDSRHSMIADMRHGAKYVIVSMLPPERWREQEYCVEWLVEDGSRTPWICALSPGQLDRSLAVDDVGKEWLATVWDFKNGRPHKCLERKAYCQIVPALPWLRPIEKI